MTVHTMTLDSPIGALFLAASDDGLHLVEFAQPRHPAVRDPAWHDRDHPVLQRAAGQLREYFEGARQRFDLPLAASGTPFQHAVWSALSTIGFGETWSYLQLAHAIGRLAGGKAADDPGVAIFQRLVQQLGQPAA